jgi:hypothetical protein
MYVDVKEYLNIRKMKIEVSDGEVIMISQNKNVLMMNNHHNIYRYKEVKFKEEEVIVKKLFRKPVTKKVKYLVDIKIMAYHTTGKFLGYIDDEYAEELIKYSNLYKFRQNFINLKDQLKAFGCEIVKIADIEE